MQWGRSVVVVTMGMDELTQAKCTEKEEKRVKGGTLRSMTI